jgi:hypothetical protein
MVLTTSVLFGTGTLAFGLGSSRICNTINAAARGTHTVATASVNGGVNSDGDLSRHKSEAVQRYDLGEEPAWLCNETACEETSIFLSTAPVEEEGVVCELQEGLSLQDGSPVWACGKVHASSPLLGEQPALASDPSYQ